MKKKYINPEMELLEVEDLSLLASSLPVSDEEVGTDDVLAPDFEEDF